MSETYIPPQETNVPHQENDFAAIEDMQNRHAAQERREAARRAQQFIDTPEPQAASAPNTSSGWSTKAKVTTGIVLGAALGTGGTLVAADHILPGQEIASASTNVKIGEGIEPSINRDLSQLESLKIDPADATERQDVISQAVDIHYNQGVVPAGEEVKVVAEKSPIFGNVTYKAVPNSNGDVATTENISK